MTSWSLAALPDRLMKLIGEERHPAQLPKLWAFRVFLLGHVAVRAWTVYMSWHTPPTWMLAQAILFTACFGLVLYWRTARASCACAALLLSVKLYLLFPDIANHDFLELLLVVALTTFDIYVEDDRDLLLRMVRWMTVIVLFYSGFQKVLYGTYFRGQYLAFLVASVEHFADFFQHVLPPGEFARLTSYDANDPSVAVTGPYMSSSPLFLIIANGSWITEITLSFLLVLRNTRCFAVIAAACFLVLIELAAREVFFGALFMNLLLLFLHRDWNRRLLPAFAAFYGYLVLMKLGWIPAWQFPN